MNKDDIREVGFAEQITIVLRLERELQGRWVIQKFMFDEWRGVTISAINPAEPIYDTWYPICKILTYATSAEAADAMMELQRRLPNCPAMRVAPVRKDIDAAQLRPGTPTEQRLYGRYPKWGELKRKFPELATTPKDFL